MGMIVKLMLSAAKPQGLAGGKVPYGAYGGTVIKYQIKTIENGENKGMLGLNIWLDVTEGTNEDAVGRQLVVYDPLIRPEDVEGDNPLIDVSTDAGKRKFDATTARVKRLLLACAESEEKEKAIAAAKGQVGTDFDQKLPTGRKLYVYFDPADESASVKQYDRHRFLTAAEYAKVREGKIRVPRENSYGLTDDEARAMGIKRGRAEDGDDQETEEARDRRRSRVAGAEAEKGSGSFSRNRPATQPGKGKGKGKKPESEPESDLDAAASGNGGDESDDESADPVDLVL